MHRLPAFFRSCRLRRQDRKNGDVYGPCFLAHHHIHRSGRAGWGLSHELGTVEVWTRRLDSFLAEAGVFCTYTKSHRHTQIATCCKATRHKHSHVDRRNVGYTPSQVRAEEFRKVSNAKTRMQSTRVWSPVTFATEKSHWPGRLYESPLRLRYSLRRASLSI